jgi:hypothetical protein
MRAAARTILFSGMIAGDPRQGGATWAVLQYVLGLRRLGFDVCFVEPVKPSAVRPLGAALARSENAAYFEHVVRAFGLEGRAALFDERTGHTVGLDREELRSIGRSAVALISVSGMLSDAALLDPIPTRVYLDLDPGFVQMWHAYQGIDMRFDAHTHFVTVGGALGEPGCDVPTCGRDWIKSLQPVVLDEWPAVGPAKQPARDAWTTVGSWRAYGSIDYGGIFYGQKAHSLRELIDLPRRTSERFELALGIHPGERRDLESLATNGWRLLDPADVAACRLQGRVRPREERLRENRVRVVQRPQRVLPGQRPARRGAGHGLRALRADRRRAPQLPHRRRSGCGR